MRFVNRDFDFDIERQLLGTFSKTDGGSKGHDLPSLNAKLALLGQCLEQTTVYFVTF